MVLPARQVSQHGQKRRIGRHAGSCFSRSEIVCVIVRELGTKPSETGQELAALFSDFVGCCLLLLFPVVRKIRLRLDGWLWILMAITDSLLRAVRIRETIQGTF